MLGFMGALHFVTSHCGLAASGLSIRGFKVFALRVSFLIGSFRKLGHLILGSL